MDKAARDEVKRDVARHEATMVRLVTNAAGSAWAQMESKLTQVQHALTTSEGFRLKGNSELDSVQQALAVVREACQKAEEEIFRLIDERLSLIMELGAGKEEQVAF